MLNNGFPPYEGKEVGFPPFKVVLDFFNDKLIVLWRVPVREIGIPKYFPRFSIALMLRNSKIESLQESRVLGEKYSGFIIVNRLDLRQKLDKAFLTNSTDIFWVEEKRIMSYANIQ